MSSQAILVSTSTFLCCLLAVIVNFWIASTMCFLKSSYTENVTNGDMPYGKTAEQASTRFRLEGEISGRGICTLRSDRQRIGRKDITLQNYAHSFIAPKPRWFPILYFIWKVGNLSLKKTRTRITWRGIHSVYRKCTVWEFVWKDMFLFGVCHN